ncbi:MAG: DUF2971 domain-containing protein [Methylomarinum sp.]|nr:DUF2971 domain-containing protein [Methylomarinum sp.]
MANIPTIRNLKELSLRASIALSLRATQRVSQLLKNSPTPTESNSQISNEIFNVGLLLVKSFCEGTLSANGSRLADIMEDTKWDSKEGKSFETDDPILRSGSLMFSATMQAQFGHLVEPELPTFSNATYVIELAYKSLIASLEAASAISEEYRSSFLEGVWCDYECLLTENISLYPEYGTPINTSSAGLLGTLWCGNEPTLTFEQKGAKDNPEPPLLDRLKHVQLDCNHPLSAIVDLSTEVTASIEEGYLYKYVSYDTLLKVLKNSTLQFSRVSNFNDPFDGQLLPIHKFGWTHFFSALRNEVASLVINKDETIYPNISDIPADTDLFTVAQQVQELLNQRYIEIAVPPKHCDDSNKVTSLSKLLRPMIYLAQQGQLGSTENAQKTLNGLLDLFQNKRIQFPLQDTDRLMIPALAEITQVLCLSEVPDSLLMWSHYADEHKGAVLKFDVSSEAAGYFEMARPISYERKLPSVSEPCGLARHFLGLPTNMNYWTSRQFFTKSMEWAYEKEWRVTATTEMLAQGELVKFQRGSLAAIYLGCRIDSPKISCVLDLITEKQYESNVYVAVKDEAEFALSFVPMSNGKARTSTISNLDIKERERRYRWCLDTCFDFMNEFSDRVHGDINRLKMEGFLADYGPTNSKKLFREMIHKLLDTFTDKPAAMVNKEKEPEEYRKQFLKILHPSAKAWGELEDVLKADLIKRGGILPERKES